MTGIFAIIGALPVMMLNARRRGSARRARVSRSGWVAAVVTLVACGGAGGEGGPRAVALGVDACDYCHMTLDDPGVAAQWVPDTGRIRVFDEPGCLVAWLQRNPEASGRAFVSGEGEGEWIPVDDAVFTVGAIRTAMGFDIRAHASAAEAVRVMGEGRGVRVTWAELIERGVDDAHEH